jgi:hypothetical protein
MKENLSFSKIYNNFYFLLTQERFHFDGNLMIVSILVSGRNFLSSFSPALPISDIKFLFLEEVSEKQSCCKGC